MAPPIATDHDALRNLAISGIALAMIQSSALTILIYDWLLTLEKEVTLVWSSKWSLGKALYFLTRYPPFVDVLICLSRRWVPNKDSATHCPIPVHIGFWFVTVGMHVAELILVLRTWAICGRNKWVLRGLLFFQMLIFLYNAASLEIFLRSIVWLGPELPGVVGCLILSAPGRRYFSIAYINLAAFELCIFVMTTIVCYRRGRRNGSGLFYVVWRDGLIFFLLIFMISALNVMVMFAIPHEYSIVLTLFQRVLHSIATGRILLHMREEVSRKCIAFTIGGGQQSGWNTTHEKNSKPICFAHDVTFECRDELTFWIGGESQECSESSSSNSTL
ncbi:hypothetical protein DL96DRAFT_1021899 [Flagelloscypha sp. PMI_526]|nr:hypothetical protein DL96DRAFT_1021899 [Flagelloscypha sp. PMI_526]